MNDKAIKSLKDQIAAQTKRLNLTKDNLVRADLLNKIEKLKMALKEEEIKKLSITVATSGYITTTDTKEAPEYHTEVYPENTEPVIISMASSDTDPVIDLSEESAEDHNRGIVYSNNTGSDNNNNKKKKH